MTFSHRATSIMVVPILALSSVGGCAGGTCTQIGCTEEGFAIRLPPVEEEVDDLGEMVVTVCLGDRCDERILSADEVTNPDGFTVFTPSITADDVSLLRRTRATIQLEDQAGSVVWTQSASTRVKMDHPNGAGCPPTCYSADPVDLR